MTDNAAGQVEHGLRTEHAAAFTPLAVVTPRHRMEILGSIILVLLLAALDQTIVGVALPQIVAELRGTEFYTWTVTIYLLTSTISVPFWGKLSDIYGRKITLTSGITIFLAGSVLCGLSGEMWQLILFRGIQGIGAGALFPVSLAVIGDLFSPAERGKYQGIFAAVFGLAALIGPALGGFLTDTISWHAIFFVNIPVGIVSLIVLWRVMPPLKREGVTHSLDTVGAALFTLAVAPFLIGLTNAEKSDWLTPQVGGLIALGFAVFGGFLLWERRATEPIVPIHLFRGRAYSTTITAVFLASFGFFAAIVFLPLHFQVVEGKSATESGYLMFPLLIGLMIGSIGSGQLVARTGRYKALILGSLALVAVGSWLMTHLEAGTPYPLVAVWMTVLGLGIGPTLAVFTIVIQNVVPMAELGAATSSLAFFRQIGGSIGLAVAGSLFGARIAGNIADQVAFAGVPPEFAGFFSGGGTRGGFDRNELGAGVDLAAVIGGAIANAPIPDELRQTALALVPKIVDAIHQGMAITIGEVFWLGVVAMVLALLVAVLIPEVPLRAHAAASPGAASGSGGLDDGERAPVPVVEPL
jgi:EmrB/QacA subfamily drug resistance transporter